MTREEFHNQYAAALRDYLTTRSEEDLAVGHELGRRAVHDDISMLQIVENHSELVRKMAEEQHAGFDGTVTLAFLLQTLAPLDVVARGFLDGTKRYEE
jgi:Phosphoserine phosphatase RsbU, N-terminal domain